MIIDAATSAGLTLRFVVIDVILGVVVVAVVVVVFYCGLHASCFLVDVTTR